MKPDREERNRDVSKEANTLKQHVNEVHANPNIASFRRIRLYRDVYLALLDLASTKKLP